MNKNDLNENAENIKDAAQKGYQNAEDSARSFMDEVKNRAIEMKDSAKDYLKNNTERIKDSAQKAETVISDYVRDNPWKSLGISMLIGMSTAFLLRRRNS